MKKLFLVFFRQIAPQAGWVLLGLIVFTTLTHHYAHVSNQTNWDCCEAIVGWILPLLIWGPLVIHRGLVGDNLDWLLSLPLTKREVLKINAGVRLMTYVSYTAAYLIFLIFGFVFLDFSPHVFQGEVKISYSDLQGMVFVLRYPIFWFILFTFASLGCSILFSIQIPSSQLKARTTQKSKKNKRVFWFIFFLFIFFGMEFLTLAQDSLPSVPLLIVFPICFLLFGLWMIRSTQSSVKLSRKIASDWKKKTIGLTLVLTACLGVLYSFNLNSDSRQLIGNSLSALQLWPWPLDRNRVARALENTTRITLESEGLDELLNYYRTTYLNSKKIGDEPEANPVIDPQFSKVYAGSSNYSLHNVRHFNPGKLKLADFLAILPSPQKLDSKNLQKSSDYFRTLYSYFLRIPASETEIIALLNSSHPLETQLGLERALFDQRASYLEVVQQKLKDYPNHLQLQASLVISVLTGRKVGQSEIDQIKSGQLKLKLGTVDCSQLPTERLTTHELLDHLDLVNVCLRQRGLAMGNSQLQGLSQAPWIESVEDYLKARPFTEYSRKVQ